ncbi:unnamed protein product, partial [Rotaria sp. Silwood1]
HFTQNNRITTDEVQSSSNTNEKDSVVITAAADQTDFDNTLPMDTEPSTELTPKLDVFDSALSVQHSKGNNGEWNCGM